MTQPGKVTLLDVVPVKEHPSNMLLKPIEGIVMHLPKMEVPCPIGGSTFVNTHGASTVLQNEHFLGLSKSTCASVDDDGAWWQALFKRMLIVY